MSDVDYSEGEAKERDSGSRRKKGQKRKSDNGDSLDTGSSSRLVPVGPPRRGMKKTRTKTKSTFLFAPPGATGGNNMSMVPAGSGANAASPTQGGSMAPFLWPSTPVPVDPIMNEVQSVDGKGKYTRLWCFECDFFGKQTADVGIPTRQKMLTLYRSYGVRSRESVVDALETFYNEEFRAHHPDWPEWTRESILIHLTCHGMSSEQSIIKQECNDLDSQLFLYKRCALRRFNPITGSEEPTEFDQTYIKMLDLRLRASKHLMALQKGGGGF